MLKALWKAVWQFLIKLNMQLPYDLVTVLFGSYPREINTYVHTIAFV